MEIGYHTIYIQCLLKRDVVCGMMKKQIAIIGGSGFIGGALREALQNQSYAVRIISRRRLSIPEADCRIYNPEKPQTLFSALASCDAAVNLVGILNQRLFRPHDFTAVHVRLVESIIEACKRQNIRRYLHISALNVSADAPSRYLRSKYHGELIVRNSGLQTAIFRPSVVFGKGDSFINRFAGLLRILARPFPLACPKTRLAPVYVGDLVQLMLNSIENPPPPQHIMHVCGPRVYTLKELVEYTARELGRKPLIIPLPDALAKIQACIAGALPGRPFTMDNYRSLQLHSICPEKTTLCSTRLEDIVPGYIHERD